MRTLLDTLPVGVFTAMDPDCRHVVGNRAANELVRAEPGENVARAALAATRFIVTRDGDEVPPAEMPLRRAARGEEVRNEALEIRFHDGTVAHTLNSAAGLYAADQRIRGAVCAVLDITVLRRQEEQLRDADRRKDEFLATLAHELRNPLAPIRNSLHILRLREPADAGRLQVLDMMDR
ncbi:MAG: PAS domain-containing protein, partial [Gammaproteobacteria bacterium]|nr:PAS domain-containing protein [Gammaproteobacteria bacterium]